ncbi:hypothetical protein ACFQZ4_46485 [Catellatospora coxensis]
MVAIFGKAGSGGPAAAAPTAGPDQAQAHGRDRVAESGVSTSTGDGISAAAPARSRVLRSATPGGLRGAQIVQ